VMRDAGDAGMRDAGCGCGCGDGLGSAGASRGRSQAASRIPHHRTPHPANCRPRDSAS
jgi:hypothetical protein